jgi:GNAT superfamily N-acetyltransferase
MVELGTMDLTPESGKFSGAPTKNGEVVRTFSSLKAWLSNDPKAPMTPKTPKTPSFLKNQVLQESSAVTTDHPSSEETKDFSDASGHMTEDPTHPSATGVSETSNQEQNEVNYCFKRPPSILGTINQLLSPEKPTEQESIKRRATPTEEEPAKRRATPAEQESVERIATPIYSSKPIDGMTEFEKKSPQRRKVSWVRSEALSWDISEDISDNGCQDDQAQNTTPEEANVTRNMGWLDQISMPPVAVDLLASAAKDHHKRDIDPMTGEFLPEIIHPDTFKTLSNGPSRGSADIAWRQANLTVELQITREIKVREAIANKNRLQMESIQREVKATPVEPPAWPDAECIVRPATPQDFEAIAAIMNLESKAKNNPQLFEWKEVVAEDIQRIHKSCQDHLRPFVVATSAGDPLLDRSNWPENATKAYHSYIAFRSSQAEVPQEIFGFGFVTEARIGILGTACPGSRHAGQIRVIVHPNHRGKLYGSALLDRILLCTAPFHRSMVDYEWQCQNTAKTYENISYQNQRKYAWVYVETFCTDRADPAMQLVTNFLQKFEFKEVGCLPSAIKTDRYYESQWLDLVLWAREAQPRSNIVDSMPGAQPEADRSHLYQTLAMPKRK